MLRWGTSKEVWRRSEDKTIFKETVLLRRWANETESWHINLTMLEVDEN